MKVHPGRLLIIVLATALLSPSFARAQDAPAGHVVTTVEATDCTPIVAWFSRIPEPDAVNSQIAAAPADASGTNYTSQLKILNQIVANLNGDNQVPAAAAAAQKQLVAGYTSLASSLSLWVQGIQSGAPGGIQSLSQVLNANIQQSQGRNLVVDGYRLRADLAGICSASAATTIGRGCPAVNAWMIPAASYVKGMWDAIQQELKAAADERAKEAANPGLINIGGLLAAPETWTNYFFTQALALAVIPGPAPEAVAVKQEIVAQLIGQSDLYLLDMMGIWSGYLGGDAATSQRITDGFTKQSTMLSTAFAKLQTDWAALAKTCGSTVLLPAAP